MTEPTIETTRCTLLDDATAAAAREAVGEIARALREPPAAWIPAPGAEPYRRARGAALCQGRAGLALFYAHLARSGLEVPGVDAAGLARSYLQEARETLEAVPMPLSLIRGCAGVLWASHQVAGLLDAVAPGPLELADEYLGYPLARDGFDLWQGLVGHGIYALEGLPDPAAAGLVADLVDRLDAAAVRDDTGARWLTHPEYLAPSGRRRHTRPHANLGAAHGQAGVVAFLARACAAGVAVETTRGLAGEAVRWLRARIRSGPDGLFLPTRHDPAAASVMGMETWCNGTPGAAAALLVAAACCRKNAWRDTALDLARDAARRARRLDARPDASVCHGAAGEAMLWHVFHRATGEELFAAAARDWYRRTLELRRPGEGVAGWVALGFDNLGHVVEIHDPGLLQGAAGVGLVLLLGLDAGPADWLRALLVPHGIHRPTQPEEGNP